MRTANSVSPSLTGADVLGSLIAYMIVYLLMYPFGIAVMARMIRQGPATSERPIQVTKPAATIPVPAE